MRGVTTALCEGIQNPESSQFWTSFQENEQKIYHRETSDPKVSMGDTIRIPALLSSHFFL
jgi:hypothetical protein